MVFGLGSALPGKVDINSHHNSNVDPPVAVYPTFQTGDASYSLAEASLRSAIFVPAGFKYGNDGKTAVILVPGTGSFGGEAYKHNFAKLLVGSSFGDPVWLNIPGRMCDESPKNAEHVAYAINYIAVRCKQKVAVVAWSQGNLSTQWALKYWPSTRKQVDNFICLSADFRGTIQAWSMAPVQNTVPGTPAIWHQRRNSTFIAMLRSNGGDSAYVPTTSIYSATDEVVQPQHGTHASAFMKDERSIGVTNCEVQVAALMRPAGGAYLHAGVMFNPLAWALMEDAIVNGGPGRLDRIALKSLSMLSKTPGLSALDVIQTQALNASCLAAILTFMPKPWNEPPLPAYAVEEKRTYVAEAVVMPPTQNAAVEAAKIVDAQTPSMVQIE